MEAGASGVDGATAQCHVTRVSGSELSEHIEQSESFCLTLLDLGADPAPTHRLSLEDKIVLE